MEVGYLKVYIGCMFSGKTTALLNEISKYNVMKENILVVNHTLDAIRNQGECSIVSHNGEKHGSVMVSRLKDILGMEEYKRAKIVIIDEGQFYGDIYEVIKDELRKGRRKFIVGGLSGDFNMRPIGQMINLVPVADEIIKLEAYCVYCKNGNKASFTKRITEDIETIVVGKEDIYVPVCRKHHVHNI
jgi:thymidine kinase